MGRVANRGARLTHIWCRSVRIVSAPVVSKSFICQLEGSTSRSTSSIRRWHLM